MLLAYIKGHLLVDNLARDPSLFLKGGQTIDNRASELSTVLTWLYTLCKSSDILRQSIYRTTTTIKKRRYRFRDFESASW